jgi:hypothetical protein
VIQKQPQILQGRLNQDQGRMVERSSGTTANMLRFAKSGRMATGRDRSTSKDPDAEIPNRRMRPKALEIYLFN